MHDTTCDKAGLRRGERRACMGGLANEVYRDTRFRIVTRDEGTVLRYSAAARHDTAQGGSRHCAQQRMWGAQRHGGRHACYTATIRPGIGATRPRGEPRHGASERCARGLGVVGVQSSFRVCTWCTQPSFGLSALFQSLFGPLFMNVVHEHYSKKFQNKIK